jgi:two-component system, chemotaxis family, chemotaxis protein CheY
MKRCLIVDDSDIVRKIARRILESLNLEVSEADSGQSGIEVCQTNAPDAILLDWLMPDMSGLDFLGALRGVSHDSQPFVLYCTTENDPEAIARALSAGAHDVLLKPFSREELATKFTQAGLA